MIDGFTPAQQQAVTAGEGPLAIIAGPGCGKTTVLAARIAHLVRERGADPSSILVLTFTAEAAHRLRHEVGRQLGSSTADLSTPGLASSASNTRRPSSIAMKPAPCWAWPRVSSAGTSPAFRRAS